MSTKKQGVVVSTDGESLCNHMSGSGGYERGYLFETWKGAQRDGNAHVGKSGGPR